MGTSYSFFLQIDKESKTNVLEGGGRGRVLEMGAISADHEHMFQMTLLLFKENNCAKLF